MSFDLIKAQKKIAKHGALIARKQDIGTSSGGGSSSDHATLSHLDYADAGHTGFMQAGAVTDTDKAIIMVQQQLLLHMILTYGSDPDYIFNYPSGIFTFNSETFAEADTQNIIPINCSLKNVFLNVLENIMTVNATLVSRINGANGNISITITSGNTGTFSDTTHTDSITQGDLFCFKSSWTGAEADETVDATASYVLVLV